MVRLKGSGGLRIGVVALVLLLYGQRCGNLHAHVYVNKNILAVELWWLYHVCRSCVL